MKHTHLLGLSTICLLMACTNQPPKAEHAFIRPLHVELGMANLIDTALPAAFQAQDIDWKARSITFTTYSEDLYDTLKLNHIQVGDTLLFDQDTLLVEKIVTETPGELTINGDIDDGGAFFRIYKDGTFRAVQYDDHSIYTELSRITLPLSPDFQIIDCGENPTDPNVIIKNEQEAYLLSLPDYKQDFNYLATKVQLRNGMVTHIIRRWIP